ncbi:hypothetical protein H0H93_001116 [Arthromyces matolae]|nr:hypothetical protein H0H93_001116 [Arthromyces matolae]
MTMHAIGTASNGETTYAIDEVQSIFVDVNAIEASSVTSTVASTYTTEPFTRHATLVEDATHRVYDIAYPTGDPAGPLVIHDDCSLDGNGTGQCVDVLQYPGIFPTPTTLTVTYAPGPLTPIYTITVPDATATSAKPNGTISGRGHLREALIGWFMAVAGVLSAGVLLL